MLIPANQAQCVTEHAVYVCMLSGSSIFVCSAGQCIATDKRLMEVNVNLCLCRGAVCRAVCVSHTVYARRRLHTGMHLAPHCRLMGLAVRIKTTFHSNSRTGEVVIRSIFDQLHSSYHMSRRENSCIWIEVENQCW